MPLNPTSSHGGGSVSAPLTLTAPNDTNPVLTLVAAAGTIADGNTVLSVVDEHGAEELHLDPDILRLVAGFAAGAMQLSVQQTDAGGGGLSLHSATGIDINGGSIRLRNAGANSGGVGLIVAGPYAAPADGVFASGQWTIWLDRTAGAPSLRIKATDINGDPFTATIPLT